MANINAFSNFGLRSILEKEKLNGNNFLDWSRNLRIVLKHERQLDVLDKPFPDEPAQDASVELKEAYDVAIDRSLDVTCLMLASMVPELQKQFEDQEAFEIMTQLKAMFGKQARTERFDTVKAILDSRLKKGESVGPHVLKMKSHFENLERLGVQFGEELAIDIILHSLHDGFSNFIQNYNMNSLGKSINELHGMLKTAEQSFPTEPKKDVLMVQKDKKVFKRKGKAQKPSYSQGKGKAVAKAKVKAGATPEQKCFYCNQNGHWKRNCPKYLKDKKDGNVASTSGIYMIEINFAISNSWVLDTGCGSHICTNVQGLRDKRDLMKGEVDLRVANGAKVATLGVGNYCLSLPSRLLLELNNCYYVPAMNRNLISIYALDDEGFEFMIKNGSFSIFKDNVCYGVGRRNNGLYILDLDKQSYHVDNHKRLKSNDSN